VNEEQDKRQHKALKRLKKIKKSLYYIPKAMAQSFMVGVAGAIFGGPILGPVTGLTTYSISVFVYAHRFNKDGVKLTQSEDFNQYINKLTSNLEGKNRQEIEMEVLKIYALSNDENKRLIQHTLKNLSKDKLLLLYGVNRFAQRSLKENLSGQNITDMEQISNKYSEKYKDPVFSHQEIKLQLSLKIQELLKEIRANEKLEEVIKNVLKTGDMDPLNVIFKQKPNLEIFLQDGKRALHLACENNNFELTKVLLKNNGDLNAEDLWGKLPLDYAKDPVFLRNVENFVKNSRDFEVEINKANIDWEKIEKIINHDIDVNTKDKTGDSILHKAAVDGKVNIIEKLIRKGADVNLKNEDGMTPLYVAVGDPGGGGDREVIEALLNRGANPNIGANEHYMNNTPLHNAAIYMVKKEIFELLIQNGANPMSRNTQKNTFFNLARKEKRIEIVEMIKENPKMVKEEYREKTLRVIRSMEALDKNNREHPSREVNRGL